MKVIHLFEGFVNINTKFSKKSTDFYMNQIVALKLGKQKV